MHPPHFPGPPISEPWGRGQGHSLCYAPFSLALTLGFHLQYPVTRGLGTHISFWFTVFLLMAKLVTVERSLVTFSIPFLLVHTNTHVHTSMHTYTHLHTQTHTHTHTRVQSSHYSLGLGRKQLTAVKLLLVILLSCLPGC